QLAGLRALPPIRSHLVDQVRAQLRMPDLRPQIVRRIEARIHIPEVAIRRIVNARRGSEPLLIVLARQARVLEGAPEGQLEAKLGRVAAEEERLQEDRPLRVLRRLLIGETEVLGMPARLSRNRLADV